jgi:enoyl-CoA hydratase/carnithine racemase
MSAAEPVTLSVEAGIATMTLNRPESLNALSQEMIGALNRQVDVIAGRRDIRAVLITGQGRALSAGGDLLEFETALRRNKAELLGYLAYSQDVLQKVEDIPVPVIGVANGTAVAGGLELLLCCDIILAAEGTKIGDGHVCYGVVPAGGATVRLAERLSVSHAAQLFYTGALHDAAMLCDWGLVNEVVPGDQLMPRAHALAAEIAARSPEAIRHIKALRREARDPSRTTRLRAELDHFADHVHGADLAAGLAAFRSKQSPTYQDVS